MAYRIEYPGSVPECETLKHSWKLHNLAVLLILGLLGSTLLPAGRSKWMNVLIPGDDLVTQAAVRELINEMRQGEKLDEAFIDFCGSLLYESA